MLIPKEAFQALRVASKESVGRHCLEGLQIERGKDGKPFVVATDGAMMLVASWTELDEAEFPAGDGGEPILDLKPHPGFSVTISALDAQEAPGLVPKRSNLPVSSFVALEEQDGRAEGSVRMAGTDLERVKRLGARAVEGKYPDWRSIVETAEKRQKSFKILLRADKLVELLRTIQAVLGKPKEPIVTMTIPAPDKDGLIQDAIRLEAKNGETETDGYLMPCAKEM